jgi:hypothetical protein
VEFVPYGGWRDFDPTAMLVLKVQDPPLRLSSACIARMTMGDFIPIWKVRMWINFIQTSFRHRSAVTVNDERLYPHREGAHVSQLHIGLLVFIDPAILFNHEQFHPSHRRCASD